MSCSTPSATLTLTAGQISAVPLTFRQPGGEPLDLTGATVRLVAKASLSDEDEDAILDLSQDTHIDAAEGETTLPVDLSGLPAAYFSSGGKLSASLWVIDSQAQRIPYGALTVDILPSALRFTA